MRADRIAVPITDAICSGYHRDDNIDPLGPRRQNESKFSCESSKFGTTVVTDCNVYDVSPKQSSPCPGVGETHKLACSSKETPVDACADLIICPFDLLVISCVWLIAGSQGDHRGS